jgi:uncharacterized membrane protein HdeD (DUF308 family)
MSLETSKKILKIFGIFDIICGALVIILAVMGFVGVSQTSADDPSLSSGIAGLAIILILGVVALLEGIFSIRGSKDPSKIMPAWIFAIFGVISGVSGLFTGSSLGSAISTLVINIVIFIAANNIKKSNSSN